MNKMSKVRVCSNYLFLFALGACSSKFFTASKNDDGGGRSPASGVMRERVPAGPDGHGAVDGGHSDSHSDSQNNSGRSEPKKDERIGALGNRGPGREGGLVPSVSNARTGCGSASLMRIDMGNGYSANDILARIEEHGTFSGVTQIPTWRSVPLVGGYQQWIVDYATSVEKDAKTLEPWLKGSAPGVSAEEIQAMAGDSEVYKYAVDFASGEGALRVYKGQYDMGHRMAAILAVMFAASSQGDPDCADYVRRTWVPKLLPNSQAASMFDRVRISEVAKLAKEGRLNEVFDQTHNNRLQIEQDIKNAQYSLKTAELDNKYQLDRIKWELKESYETVNQELQEIPGCESATSAFSRFLSPDSSVGNSPEQLVQNCRNKVYEKLSSARNAQLRIQGELKVYEKRSEYEKERLERAEERGDDKEIERRNTSIARYSEKIKDLREKNDKAVERTEKYEEALELVANPEASSFSEELDRIRELMGDKTSRESDSYFREYRSSIHSLEGRMKTTTDNYLTMGYMGAFER